MKYNNELKENGDSYRTDKRDIELERMIVYAIGKVNSVPNLLVEKFGIEKNIKIVLRGATSTRASSVEHILLKHKKEILKDYDRYIEKIKECISNPIDIKKVKDDKFYLYSFFGIGARRRNGKDHPEIFMQTIIQKEKDSNYFTVVSAFPNIK